MSCSSVWSWSLYTRLYGWFLSFPMHPSLHGSLLTSLFSLLIHSILNFSHPSDRPQQHLCLISLPPITFPFWLYSFPQFLLSVLFLFITLSFCHLSLVVPFLCCLHPSFFHSLALLFPPLLTYLIFFVINFLLIAFTILLFSSFFNSPFPLQVTPLYSLLTRSLPSCCLHPSAPLLP